jgi:hypothetical protein
LQQNNPKSEYYSYKKIPRNNINAEIISAESKISTSARRKNEQGTIQIQALNNTHYLMYNFDQSINQSMNE